MNVKEHQSTLIKFLLFISTVVVAVSGISNGIKAELGEFPYIASIQSYGNHICGGAVISTKHVLTAAHCLFRNYDKALRVEVGMTKIGYGMTRNIRRIAFLKNFTNSYQPIFLENDIAVIHLDRSVVPSKKVSVIGLPKSSEKLEENRDILVAGFGRNSRDRSDHALRKFQTKVADECIIKNGTLSQFVFCDQLVTGRSACKGDSGSPVVDLSKNIIYGVISGVDNICGGGYESDVFTNVGDFISFIKDELKYDFDKPATQNNNRGISLKTR